MDGWRNVNYYGLSSAKAINLTTKEWGANPLPANVVFIEGFLPSDGSTLAEYPTNATFIEGVNAVDLGSKPIEYAVFMIASFVIILAMWPFYWRWWKEMRQPTHKDFRLFGVVGLTPGAADGINGACGTGYGLAPATKGAGAASTAIDMRDFDAKLRSYYIDVPQTYEEVLEKGGWDEYAVDPEVGGPEPAPHTIGRRVPVAGNNPFGSAGSRTTLGSGGLDAAHRRAGAGSQQHLRHPMATNAATVTAEDVAKVTALLRRMYALDLELWSLRNAFQVDDATKIEKMHQADDILAEVRRIVNGWSRGTAGVTSGVSGAQGKAIPASAMAGRAYPPPPLAIVGGDWSAAEREEMSEIVRRLDLSQLPERRYAEAIGKMTSP